MLTYDRPVGRATYRHHHPDTPQSNWWALGPLFSTSRGIRQAHNAHSSSIVHQGDTSRNGHIPSGIEYSFVYYINRAFQLQRTIKAPYLQALYIHYRHHTCSPCQCYIILRLVAESECQSLFLPSFHRYLPPVISSRFSFEFLTYF